MHNLVLFLFISCLTFPLKSFAQPNEGNIKSILNRAKEFNRQDDAKMYQLADSAESILLANKQIDDLFFEASYLKSRVMVRKGQDLKATSYLENQLHLQKEITEHVGQNHFILGLANRHLGNEEKTIYHYNRAVQIFDSLKICNAYVKAKNNLGNYYNATSRFELALDHYKTALKELNHCSDNYSMAILERNIAGVYFNYFKDFNKGETYFEQALNSFSKLDTTSRKVIKSLIGVRISLGQVSTEKKDYKTAKNLFQNSLLKARENGLIIREIEALSGLSNIFRILGQDENSIHNFQAAIHLAEQKSYNYLLGNLYTGIAKSYIQNKQLLLAKSFLERAYKICDLNNYLQEKAEVLQLQSEVLQKEGNTEEAYLKLKEYTILKDHIFNEENNQKIQAKKADIELIKKDQEIKILQLEQEKNEAQNKFIASQLRYKNILLIALLSALILGIFITISVIKNRNKKSKITALELEQEKAKLEHNLLMNQKLEEVKLFKTAITSKKEEQDRISKDLHDNIGATLAAIKLSLNNEESDPKEILPFLDNVYNHVRDLSHHLATISKEQVDFEEILKNYIEKLTKLSSIQMHFEVIPTGSLHELSEQYQAELFSIIREGLNNAIKHSKTKEIEILITREDNFINLYIEDHGIGFNTQEKTMGIGLKNIHDRVNSLGGSFEIDTHLKRGVILNINIPYDA